jgi:hypothetical protein
MLSAKTDKENRKMRKDLDLNSGSRVLLFSTEGDTDPDVYRDIVWAQNRYCVVVPGTGSDCQRNENDGCQILENRR